MDPNEVVQDPDNPTVELSVEEGTPDAVVEPPESETQARALGWVPKDEWKSDPDKWRSADEFMFVRENVQKVIKQENSSLKAQLEQLAVSNAALLAEARERKAQQENFRVENLKLERKQALENGDHALAAEIGDKLTDLRQAPVQQPQGPQITPQSQAVWTEFASNADNKWIEKPDNQQKLELEMRMLRTAGVTAVGKDFLDLAVDRMKRMYPEEFAQRKAPAMAETGGRQGVQVNGSRSWNDLKPEVKNDLEEMIRMTPGLTKAGILKRCTTDQFKR